MRYWNMAGQRYFPGLARCRRALRLSADRAGNAACKPARKAGVLDHEDKVTRETDSLLEGDGFEPSVPREGNYATRLPRVTAKAFPSLLDRRPEDRHVLLQATDLE